MSWTDDRVKLLKQLWGEGKTAAEIAKELGGVTRNAVIGKAHRLKLNSRLSPIQQNVKKAKSERKDIAHKPTPIRKVEFKGLGIKLRDLENDMCRWPSGDPKDKDFVFCGCKRVEGLPYCPEHCKAAFQVQTRSRKLNAADFNNDAGSPADFDIKTVANG